MKRLTKEEFIRRANEIHGEGTYCYDNVVYVNAHTKVTIYCPKHGQFEQSPNNHLYQKSGCPTCELLSRGGKPQYFHRKLIYGVGILDVEFASNRDEITKLAYDRWLNILSRCYKDSKKRRFAKYRDCYISEEWKSFSNFLKWFIANYKDCTEIDKDILKKGNKCYCAEYCCCVPKRINTLLENRSNYRGELPIGVYRNNKKYYSKFGGKDKVYLGTFDTPEAAFYAYKTAKEAYIKEVAQEYYDKGLITRKVYNALMNWEIEITD